MRRRFLGCLFSSVILSVSAGAATSASADEKKDFAYAAVDRNADAIAKLSDAIYFFSEPGFQEVESSKLLQETLEAAGFKVELGGAGMPTNVWATWGEGEPVVAIVTEIDALPLGSQTPGNVEHVPLVEGAPGHMEGHNTHAGVAVGAAFAVKEAMEEFDLPGTVAISFGPAEELLASRPFLVRAGYFDDVDAAILIHIGDNLETNYGLGNYAAIGARFTFHGKTAHGAVNPWDGKDAVDAVELMDIGMDKMREHMRPTYRAHRTITMGGVQPNIIPDTGQIWWYVRDASGPAAKENFDKLMKIAEGAALMTGTTMESQVIASAWPKLGNEAIARAIQANIDEVGLPEWDAEEVAFAKKFQNALGIPEVGLSTEPGELVETEQSTSSNDNGDVTWVVPSGQMTFPSAVPGVRAHNWQAGVGPTMSFSHKGQVAGAKVLAASLLDLLTDPALIESARAEFEKVTAESQYFSLLPDDAQPTIEMNSDMMAEFRPQLEQFYLKDVHPRFE